MYKSLSRFMQHLATKSRSKSSNTRNFFYPVPERLKKAYHHKFLIGGKIIGKNKGGYIVEIDGFKAFCPFSEMYEPDLLLKDPNNPKEKRRGFEFLVLELKSRSCILSRIKALKIRTREKINKSIAERKPLSGTVKTLKPYGAFIDLGGIDGLLHVSEIPNHLKGTTELLLKPNNKVSVYIINIEDSTDKISLSMLEPAKPTNPFPRSTQGILTYP